MIKIMLDSAFDCRPADSFCDYFVPISIHVNNNDYLDGVTLERDGFYQLLTESREFPKTSQPSPQTFLEQFEQAKAKGDEVIYFSVAADLSGTYQSASLAKQMADYDKIHLVDSSYATHMIRIIAEYAAKLAAEGLSAEAIVEKCEALKPRLRVFAGVDTLEYLFRGGRLSRTEAALGELARIKPVITIRDSQVQAIHKALGRARAVQFIMKQLEESGFDPDFPIYSLYTYGEENVAQLEKHLGQKNYPLTKRLQIGSSIGSHVGPGLYGLCYVAK